MISDLIGVLYFVCFHRTYDDRVERRNSGVRSGIKRLTVETVDTLYKTSMVCNYSESNGCQSDDGKFSGAAVADLSLIHIYIYYYYYYYYSIAIIILLF